MSLTSLFKALGDETRLRMIALLSQGELCVCHLQDGLRVSQPKVSRHLLVLRSAGLVTHRRSGSWVFYRLAPQKDASKKRQLQSLIQGFDQKRLASEVHRLVRARGPGACT
jgi:ArsR family transcriptional regulator